MKKIMFGLLLMLLTLNAAPPPQKGGIQSWLSCYYTVDTQVSNTAKMIYEWTYVRQEYTNSGDYTFTLKTYDSKDVLTDVIETSLPFPVIFSNCNWTQGSPVNETVTIMSRITVKNTTSVQKTVMFQMNAIAVYPVGGLSAGNISYSKVYVIKGNSSIEIAPDGNYKEGSWSVKEWIP